MNTFEEGRMILLNKPVNWTSFDVVRKVRSTLRVKKVGHAGTLDPLATGLLIVCTGKFTKKINEYMAREKEYTGTITLGSTTPTFDLESELQDFKDCHHLDRDQLLQAARQFTGEILQVPPVHSAIKQNGTRVYELARMGIEVKMQPRKLFIHEFELTEIQLPVISFRVVCSTGTYIRSLANDFGAALNCGGHLSSLCRTRIGEFLLKDAYSVEGFLKENSIVPRV